MGWGLRVGCLAPCTQHPPRLPLWLLFTWADAPKTPSPLRLFSCRCQAELAALRKQDSKKCYIQMHLLYPNTGGLGWRV